MYGYIDTKAEKRADTDRLPSEAVMVDGEYLDLLIDGFTTLYVKGRDGMSAEIETTELKTHGSIFRNRRYPERVITVGFRILSDNAEDYRRKWNQLAGYLNKDQVELRFADEPDKHFTGIPASIEQPEPGRLNVKTEISFICPDPFKYSEEKEIVLDTKTIEEDGKITVGKVFDYKGTANTLPVIDINFDGFASDVGYMKFGLDNQDIQQGNSKTEYFNSDYFLSGVNEWKNNEMCATASNFTACGSFSISRNPSLDRDCLGVYTFGTADTRYYGPTKLFELAPVSYDQINSYNANIQIVMGCGPSYTQYKGIFRYFISDEDDDYIFKLEIIKSSLENTMYINLAVQGDTKNATITYDNADREIWNFSFKKTGNSLKLYLDNELIKELTMSKMLKIPKKIMYGFFRDSEISPLHTMGFGQYNAFSYGEEIKFKNTLLTFGGCTDSNLTFNDIVIRNYQRAPLCTMEYQFDYPDSYWRTNQLPASITNVAPGGGIGAVHYPSPNQEFTYRGITSYGSDTSKTYRGPTFLYPWTNYNGYGQLYTDYSYYGDIYLVMGCGPSYKNQYGIAIYQICDKNQDPIVEIKIEKPYSKNYLNIYHSIDRFSNLCFSTADVSSDKLLWDFRFFKIGKKFYLYNGNPSPMKIFIQDWEEEIFGNDTCNASRIIELNLPDEEAKRRPRFACYALCRDNSHAPLSHFGFNTTTGENCFGYIDIGKRVIYEYNTAVLGYINLNALFYTNRLLADCSSGELKYSNLEGNDTGYEFGNIINQYNKFQIKPGLNSIFYRYSDKYTITPPTVKIKYREVFI